MAIITGAFTTFVTNVQSLQGLSQCASGYYFLHGMTYIFLRAFQFSRPGDVVLSWKFEQVTLIAGMSFLHRIILIFFNIYRPKSFQGWLGLVQSMGVELFFLSRKHFSGNQVYRNTIGDLCIAIPYLIEGVLNITGEKSSYERNVVSLKMVRDRVLRFEVQIETCRDLQRVQRNLRDIDEIDRFYDELQEKQTLLNSRDEMNRQIVELNWLKKIVTGTENAVREEEDKLTDEKKDLTGTLTQSEKDKIEFQLKVIEAALTLIKPESRRHHKAQLEDKVSKKELKLKKQTADLRDAEQNSRNTDELRVKIKKLRLRISMLLFVLDPISLEEELNSLTKLIDEYDFELSKKQEMVSLLLTYMGGSIIAGPKRKSINDHLLSLRSWQQENFKALAKKDVDIKKLKLGEKIEPKFDPIFDVMLLEQIAVKLISCDQFVQRLRGATDLEGLLHKDFDDWLSKATAQIGKGKTVDPAKKIAKSDLYDAILTEIQAIESLLDELEVRVKIDHKDFIEEFQRFRIQIKEYGSAVKLVFNRENDEKRTEKFNAATLAKVQPTLVFLRRAFQKELDVLLSELKDAQEKLQNPHELRSRWDWYARPWSMIAFAVFILGVRYFKYRNFITTYGFADQVLDMSFMGILGLSQIVPLFYRDITHRPKEIIVLREGKQPLHENILEVWQSRFTSAVKYLKSFKPI